MARIARVVAIGLPHHITQRGNRRQRTFFEEGDYRLYIELMAEWCDKRGVEIWAYCLMPNHVHMIVVPSSQSGLAGAIGEAHRRYSRAVNFREGWRGYLWQGRFASFVMDEKHLLACVRYVELNPVRGRLTADPWSYRWSSARSHDTGHDDDLVKVKPLLDMVGDWRKFLSEEPTEAESEEIRRHERTGRPLGDDKFVGSIEKLLGRVVRKMRPGPKPGKKHEKSSDHRVSSSKVRHARRKAR